METFIIRQPAQVTRNAFRTIVTLKFRAVRLFLSIKTAGQVMTVIKTLVMKYALITYVTIPQDLGAL